ncbi:TIGR03752 family integrating conjugative element protein [Corticibacter populi]|uniref:TIGR03752 family integrating conjugative element protein n=1 Tax=Corticibacter populi TaxID=1550736 RepID=A0A3M6QYP8_9BURK|nr:TIGR03752 family integrating conjugative element protein [Corticibacter populi]RMX08145.1 TIGR03752 family integrating conjugative element protein [Corticibacter populi]RZS35402.1 integrating conjugative element protein (TIGR03752 family) [Corticibacter populi]
MATSNRMLPIMAGAVGLIAVVIVVQRCTSDAPVRSDAPMQALPRVQAGADADTMTEALNTVTTSNNALREQVQQLVEQNIRIMRENEQLRGGRPGAPMPAGTANDVVDLGGSDVATAPAGDPSPLAGIGRAIDSATQTIGTISSTRQGMPNAGTVRDAARAANGMPPAVSQSAEVDPDAGSVAYKALAPMGWQAATETQRGKAPVVRYVRTSAAAADNEAASASQAVAKAAAARPQDEPYFTLPDNATLVDVTAMTAIIGRVPVDGRVTDPMQFKAIVGRENLAANGWELPGDIEGVIVSGIAVGDMALSCSEGHIQSLTFVFNDGTISTTRSGQSASNINTNSSNAGNQRSGYMGYISDLHGNPCIVGRFVTNAPSYLTDIVGLKSLEVAAQSFANAQTTTNQTADGFTSAVTGSRGDYVMGQAASSAASEVSNWLLSRLQNSFDAVVTPSGQRLVVHLTQEVRIDKIVGARKIVHRQQAATTQQRGTHYGLE